MEINNRLERIVPELVGLSSSLKSDEFSMENFRDAFLRYDLDALFHEYQSFCALNTVEKDKIQSIFRETAPQLRRYYARFNCDREYELAKKIMSSKKARFDDLKHEYILLKGLRHTAKAEGLNISPEDRILFIGSGPVPSTAIFLAKDAGCLIDCVEQCLPYVEISRKIVRKFGLDENIRIFHEKGEKITNGYYSMILIALLAEPKREILRNLRQVASPGTRIICRTVNGIKSLLYGYADEILFDGFDILQKARERGSDYCIYHLRKGPACSLQLTHGMSSNDHPSD